MVISTRLVWVLTVAEQSRSFIAIAKTKKWISVVAVTLCGSRSAYLSRATVCARAMISIPGLEQAIERCSPLESRSPRTSAGAALQGTKCFGCGEPR